jgi:hypothetical protein
VGPRGKRRRGLTVHWQLEPDQAGPGLPAASDSVSPGSDGFGVQLNGPDAAETCWHRPVSEDWQISRSGSERRGIERGGAIGSSATALRQADGWGAVTVNAMAPRVRRLVLTLAGGPELSDEEMDCRGDTLSLQLSTSTAGSFGDHKNLIHTKNSFHACSCKLLKLSFYFFVIRNSS